MDSGKTTVSKLLASKLGMSISKVFSSRYVEECDTYRYCLKDG
jgi:broad-specificity NMP kinase